MHLTINLDGLEPERPRRKCAPRRVCVYGALEPNEGSVIASHVLFRHDVERFATSIDSEDNARGFIYGIEMNDSSRDRDAVRTVHAFIKEMSQCGAQLEAPDFMHAITSDFESLMDSYDEYDPEDEHMSAAIAGGGTRRRAASLPHTP